MPCKTKATTKQLPAVLRVTAVNLARITSGSFLHFSFATRTRSSPLRTFIGGAWNARRPARARYMEPTYERVKKPQSAVTVEGARRGAPGSVLRHNADEYESSVGEDGMDGWGRRFGLNNICERLSRYSSVINRHSPRWHYLYTPHCIRSNLCMT